MKQILDKVCVPGMPNEDYHAHPYLGSSTLARARRSWAHAKQPFESTKAMSFGTGFHELIGEPSLFAKKYAKMPSPTQFEGLLTTVADITAHLKSKGVEKLPKAKPELIKLALDVDPKANIWDAIVARFADENTGKTILAAEDFDALDGMLGSVLNHKIALRLLTGGVAESSYFWLDKESGVGCKCRPDYYRSNDAIIDLKTAEDASESAFVRSLVQYGRHIQTAFYLDGVSAVTGREHKNFIHLVIEKTPPYAIAVYSLDDLSIDQGRREYKKLLAQYAYLEKVGEWPAYPEEVRAVSLPEWAMKYE